MSDSPYTTATEIHILMSQDNKNARGFLDNKTGMQITFAFTTKEKAEEFLKVAKSEGLLSDVDLLYKMTIGEFDQWKEKGETQSELAIDPDPNMMRHPIMKMCADKQN